MDIRKLQRAIHDGLDDVKAQKIVVFNTEHLSSLFERVIIASGTSNRQTKALAASVRDSVKAAGYPPPRTEGEANGEWIVVDCGAAVVHVMQPNIRDYYNLEEIWGGKNVNMKSAPTKTGLVKAEEPQALAVKRKRNAERDAAEIAPEKPSTRPARQRAAAPVAAPKLPQKRVVKAAVAEAAPAKRAASKTAPMKGAPTKRVPTKRAPAKTTAVRAAPTKTAATKKLAPRTTGKTVPRA